MYWLLWVMYILLYLSSNSNYRITANHNIAMEMMKHGDESTYGECTYDETTVMMNPPMVNLPMMKGPMMKHPRTQPLA